MVNVIARIVRVTPHYNDWDAVAFWTSTVERYFETPDCAAKIAERLNADDEAHGGDGDLYNAEQFINGRWHRYFRPRPPVDYGDDYIPF